MNPATQASEILFKLTGLPDEDQTRIIKLLMLFSRVPGDAEKCAWQMLVSLVANNPGRSEVLVGIELITSYMESQMSVAGEAKKRAEPRPTKGQRIMSGASWGPWARSQSLASKLPATQNLLWSTIPFGIILATLSLEYLSPLGLAAGLPYVLLVLLCLHPLWQRYLWLAAGAGTGFVLLAVLKSEAVAHPWIWSANRALTLLAIWSVAVAVWCANTRGKRHRPPRIGGNNRTLDGIRA